MNILDHVLAYMLAGAVIEGGQRARGAACFYWGDAARWLAARLPDDAPDGWL